jgi:hypothetical protein
MTKEILKEKIREVSIAKTYEEYVDALAEHLAEYAGENISNFENNERMNREKQIIEIKECIDAVYGQDCAYYDVDGFAIANEIYNAGYRKASDVAREIIDTLNSAGIDRYRYPIIAQIEKKYTEGGK